MILSLRPSIQALAALIWLGMPGRPLAAAPNARIGDSKTQTAAPIVAPGAAPVSSVVEAPSVATIFKWYQNQWFDEVIEGATTAIEASLQPDPRLLYYRGRTFYNTGFFRRAEEDLAPLGDFKPFSRWPAASEIVAKVRAARALVPPNVHRIKDSAGNTRFLIYYGRDDTWTQAAVAALQEAYTVNLKMLGFARLETPVLLFDESAAFNAFSAARAGSPQATWPAGLGGSFGFYLRRLTPASRPLSSGARSSLRTVVTHEYHHSIVNRFVGNGALPKWLTEGLARCAADSVVPAQIARDEAQFRLAWQSGGVLSFDQISERKEFMDAMEEKTTREKDSQKRIVEPYAQSHNMARYFLSHLERGELQKFMSELRAERDFPAIFQRHIGKSPADFYTEWLENCCALYGETPAAPA